MLLGKLIEVAVALTGWVFRVSGKAPVEVIFQPKIGMAKMKWGPCRSFSVAAMENRDTCT